MAVVTPIELQDPGNLVSGPVAGTVSGAIPGLLPGSLPGPLSTPPQSGRRVAWPLRWTGLLVTADTVAFASSLVAAGCAASLAGAEAQQAHAVLAVMAVVAALGVAAFAWRGHYGRRLRQPAQAGDVLLAGATGLLGTGLAAYALRLDAGLAPLAAMWGLSVPALLGARGLAHAALRRAGALDRSAIVVGKGDAALRAGRLLHDAAGPDWTVCSMLHPAHVGAMPHGGWRTMLHQHRADLVVLAMDDPPDSLVERLMRDHVPFAAMPCLDSRPVFGGVPLQTPNRDTVMWLHECSLERAAARAAKRAMDVAGAAALLVALAPVFLLVAAIVRLDGGAALYAHRRIGASGRSFPCLKFRSMVPDGDRVLAQVLRSDTAAAEEWAATRKLRDDPRVTPIGRILRQTSLDELPQLLNVLRGEMSLVGPRPIVTAEVPRYGDDIHHYYAVRPGLTGLWQVSGRSDTGYDQRVQLDAWYVRNWSLRCDIAVLARTLPAVLKRRGAV